MKWLFLSIALQHSITFHAPAPQPDYYVNQSHLYDLPELWAYNGAIKDSPFDLRSISIKALSFTAVDVVVGSGISVKLFYIRVV